MVERKQPIQYTKELLDECVKRDEAKLVGSYDKLLYNEKIEFTCKCGTEGEKTFKNIIFAAGLRCKVCSLKIMSQKAKETCLRKYGVDNYKKAQESKENPKKELSLYTLHKLQSMVGDKLIGTYDEKTICRESIIKYNCRTCNEIHEKSFLSIVKWSGALCKQCSMKNMVEKYKKSCIKKYGVGNYLSTQNVRMKLREDNLVFTHERLIEVVGDSLIGTYDRDTITGKTSIQFKCKECNDPFQKQFRAIVEGAGVLCDTCSDIKRVEKHVWKNMVLKIT